VVWWGWSRIPLRNSICHVKIKGSRWGDRKFDWGIALVTLRHLGLIFLVTPPVITMNFSLYRRLSLPIALSSGWCIEQNFATATMHASSFGYPFGQCHYMNNWASSQFYNEWKQRNFLYQDDNQLVLDICLHRSETKTWILGISSEKIDALWKHMSSHGKILQWMSLSWDFFRSPVCHLQPLFAIN
jgi:hypothetical protein